MTYIEEKIDKLEERIEEQDKEIIILKKYLKQVIDGEKVDVETYIIKCEKFNPDINNFCDGEVVATVLDIVSHICPKCGKNMNENEYGM